MKDSHCVNMGEGGFQRRMLEDLARIKDAIGCESGELLCITVTMEENDLIQILGYDLVHMSIGGYQRLTGSLINLAGSPSIIFAGDKWERKDGDDHYD